MDSIVKLNGFHNLEIIGRDKGWRLATSAELQPSKEMLQSFLTCDEDDQNQYQCEETQFEVTGGDELRDLLPKLGNSCSWSFGGGGLGKSGQKVGSRGSMFNSQLKPWDVTEVGIVTKEGHLQLLKEIKMLGRVPTELSGPKAKAKKATKK